MAKTKSTFRKGSGCFKCRVCNKQTRDVTGDNGGCQLCPECYDYAGWENTHNDQDHEHNPDPNCPVCKKDDKIMAKKKTDKKPTTTPAVKAKVKVKRPEPNEIAKALCKMADTQGVLPKHAAEHVKSGVWTMRDVKPNDVTDEIILESERLTREWHGEVMARVEGYNVKVKEFQKRMGILIPEAKVETFHATAPKKEPKVKKAAVKIERTKGQTKPGIINTIVEILKRADKSNPITKAQVLDKMVETFPDRPKEAMWRTINAQLGPRLFQDKGLVVVKSDKGYWID